MNNVFQTIVVATLAAGVGVGATLWLSGGGPFSTPHAPESVPDTAPPPSHAPLPKMQVQAQYGGPLQDTLIQRLRDPVDGTICYLYLPIAVHHTEPKQDTGYVEYGANHVGAISCFHPSAAPPAPAR